jgi:signal peptidase II
MLDENSAPFPVAVTHKSIGAGALLAEQKKPAVQSFSRSPLGLVILVALIGVAVDQGSKFWAFAASFGLPGPRRVAPGLVAGVLATNEGAVAHLAGRHPMTATICAVNGLIVLVAALWWSYGRSVPWRGRDAFFIGLLAAGMVGNSIDRLALGYVRDFLVADLWPVLIFNLADVFIVVGFLSLLGGWVASRLGRARGVVLCGESSPDLGDLNLLLTSRGAGPG